MRWFTRAGAVALVVMLLLSAMPAVVAQSPVASPVGTPVGGTHGIQLADMDLSVDPAQDFYQYANGGWLARTEIPPDYSSYGVFDALSQRTKEQQLAQLQRLMQDNALPVGSDQWKAVALFQQGTDQAAREAQGLAPVQPQLDIIASATDLPQLYALMATPAWAGLPDFFGVATDPGLADATMTSAYISAPRVGLPDVTYYTDDSESNLAVREAYKTMCARLLQLTGLSEAESIAAAQAVYDLEAAIAADRLTPVEAQDVSLIDNPMTLDQLQALYPAFDWQTYLTSAGATVDADSVVIVTELRLMQNLDAILISTDLQTIQHYLSLRLLVRASSYLDQEIRDIVFAYDQVVYGDEEQVPVDEAVLGSVNNLLPDALGQLYVAEQFSPQAKADVEQLVANLLAAFRVRLQHNPWMSEETRAKALAKLDAMQVKVGYPDTWQSYAGAVVGDSYWESIFASRIAQDRERMAEYGQPVDRDRWDTPAQQVNAFYNPQLNAIVFPAAILQPPFYDPLADPASNYGAIGYVIGHEITHAFDLLGSQFDLNGNLENWWTEADRAAFEALNASVVAEYSQLEVLPGLFVNGQLTVTENVADMGGLQVANDALQLALQ